MKTADIQDMLLETADSIWIVVNDEGGWSLMCDDRPMPSSRRPVKRWASLDSLLQWLSERVDFSVEFYCSGKNWTGSGRVRLVEVV